MTVKIQNNGCMRRFSLVGSVGAALLMLSQAGGAALDLADQPLSSILNVNPNVLLVLDDSGSMDYAQTMTDNAQTLYPREPFTKLLDVHTNINRPLQEHLDHTPDTDIEALRLCSGFNALAYDPSETYLPWEGLDENGNAYVSMTDLTRVRIDPFETGADNLTDISDHVYIEWQDLNSDGEFQIGECSTLGLGAHDYGTTDACRGDEGTTVCDGQAVDTDGVFDRDAMCTGSSLSPNTCKIVATFGGADERTNYANWYSYYRKREFVAKKATLGVVDEFSVRMGLGTMHDNNNVGLPIADMDTQANKDALMRQISRIRSSGGTPARDALGNAGEYFKNGSNDLFGDRSFPGGVQSPILSASQGGSCQKNVTLLMTDGFVKGGSPTVGNRDNDGGSGDDDSEFDGGLYADTESDTLADIAMKYFEEDLSPLADEVPVPDTLYPRSADEVAATPDNVMHQHMITYTAAFGVNGFMTCMPGVPLNDGSGGVCEADWPINIDYSDGTDPKTIDDLRHAAYNGRGDFLEATRPQELIEELERAIGAIAQDNSSAPVAANSTSLVSNTLVYQALFDSEEWSGDLKAFPVFDGTNAAEVGCDALLVGQVCTEPRWEAAALLDARDPNTRVIVTSDVNGDGIPFRWPVNDTAPETAALVSALTENGTVGSDVAQLTLNYLRGDQQFEANNTFNQRQSLLGDIVHSAPAFVGPPSSSFPESLEAASYSQFEAAQSARSPMIYVGANDGMLHAFDAITGEESLAYVPSSLFEKLTDFADPQYDHEYFVDGSPTVGDVFYSGAWHTVLVNGLRAGGRSVFALDVTNPGGFSEANSTDIVLWEFTDPDLGYTFSRPDIVKTSTGKWAAIFGSGYNKVDSSGNASDDGIAHLFVVDIETGQTIQKIAAGSAVAGLANGLATVTPVDADGDLIVDYVYAGDLLGNLWRFDLTSSSSSGWDSQKIFTAVSPTGSTPQPITTRPSVAFHPEGLGGFLVLFGTGSYIENGDTDNVNQPTQSFYAVWDKLEATTGSGAVLPAVDRTGGTDYVEQSISAELNGLRVTTDNTIDWDTQVGWYMDLVISGASSNQGERQVTNSVIRGDRVLFTTLLPDAEVCGSGGSSAIMEVSVADGGRPDEPFVDINGDGVIDSSDVIGSGTIATGFVLDGIVTEPTIISGSDVEHRVFSGSNGDTRTIIATPPSATPAGQRQSWTEILR